MAKVQSLLTVYIFPQALDLVWQEEQYIAVGYVTL